MSLAVFDPNQGTYSSSHRGGGRFLQLLKEHLSDNTVFIDNVRHLKKNNVLLVPFWHPYRPAPIKKKHVAMQIVTIFDVIPFKYPDKFPIGFKGKLHLIENLNNLKHYDHIITISENSKHDIVQYLGIEPHRIHVVHLTTNSTFYKESETDIKLSEAQRKIVKSIPKDPFCLYVGDVNWNKNITNIARAVKIAKLQGVFIGRAFLENSAAIDHPERQEFNNFMNEVEKSDQFVFPGYVEDEVLKLYYRAALCNMLVSRDEGFGLSYLEASTQMCPTILSDVPIFNEVAGSPTNALFADPEDQHSIAEKIVQLSNNAKLREDTAQNTWKHAQTYKPTAFKRSLITTLDAIAASSI